MQVRAQLMLFIASFSILFILFLLGSNYENYKSKQLYITNQTEKLEKNAKNSIKLVSATVENSINDYTYWDEMRDFSFTGDTAFSNLNLDPVVETFTDYIWVYNLKSELLYVKNNDNYEFIENPIIISNLYKLFDTVENSEIKFANYFIRKDTVLISIFGASIYPTLDNIKVTKPSGVLFFGKVIDQDFIKNLSFSTDSKVMYFFDSTFYKNTNNNIIFTKINLFDQNNNYVATLVFERTDFYLESNQKRHFQVFFLVITLSIFVLIIAYIILNSIVSKPLKKIITTLDNGKLTQINKLLTKTNEFGKISKLIVDFFIQKQKLQEAFEEVNTKNTELFQQKEEIRTQSENLKEANVEIIAQKDLIEKNHKNITDSIIYAQRIQTAVLPHIDFLKTFFPESFILFKPRDIISGDFYFIKQIRKHTIIAAADCTGHGVPGAFMSMLGIALLNEIALNPEIRTSSQVLEELRIQIKNSLQQTGQFHEQQDAIEISFVAIQNDNLTASYSGANLPLWIIRNMELIEFHPDKQPAGVYPNEKPFTEKIVQLQKNDSIYLFSDGYASQLGGDKYSLFRTVSLKTKLLEICNLMMLEQKKILEDVHANWKLGFNQTDDILIIGVKI